MPNRDDVLYFLDEVDFPASKDELVEAAGARGAPAQVLKALRAMPPVDYGNREQVARSARTDEDAVPAAERSARLRGHKHERIALGLRDQEQGRPG